MNENMCRAYDYIMESKSDPAYVKVMKWAISYEYNSPKPDDDGNPQDSHIGNYFSNILFKGASFAEKDCQMCLIYTGKIKSNMAYGSTKVTDLRTVTIEYHINGLEEIKYACKSEPALIKALDKNVPPSAGDGPALLHELAQECVRNVVMYPENDQADKHVFHHLSTLGLQLVKSPLLPTNIIRTGEKNSVGRGGSISQGNVTAFTFTIPDDIEVRKAFSRARGRANTYGIDIPNDDPHSNEDYKTLRWAERNQWTETYIENEDGSRTYTIATVGPFAELFVKGLVDNGIIDDFTTREIALNKRGEINLDGKASSAGGSKTSGGSKEGPTTSATIAFEANDFDRGAKLAGAMVKRYMNSHPKGNANIDVDSGNQSITLTGMSKGAIDDAITFLKNKGLTFSKM